MTIDKVKGCLALFLLYNTRILRTACVLYIYLLIFIISCCLLIHSLLIGFQSINFNCDRVDYPLEQGKIERIRSLFISESTFCCVLSLRVTMINIAWNIVRDARFIKDISQNLSIQDEFRFYYKVY